jgi:uncharacterized protein YcfJ
MKATIFRVAAAALVAASGAASAQVFGDVARVISATPVYERGVPHQECRPEQVTAYEQRPVQPSPPREPAGPMGAGAVIGAIVGGVIGHQFGNSSGGRDHGTAAGAVIGGLIGNEVEKNSDPGYPQASGVPMERVPVTREVQRCREVAGPDRIVGYEVRYEYNGHEFQTRLPFDPGPELAVNVDVRPPAAEAMASRRPMNQGPYR